MSDGRDCGDDEVPELVGYTDAQREITIASTTSSGNNISRIQTSGGGGGGAPSPVQRRGMAFQCAVATPGFDANCNPDPAYQDNLDTIEFSVFEACCDDTIAECDEERAEIRQCVARWKKLSTADRREQLIRYKATASRTMMIRMAYRTRCDGRRYTPPSCCRDGQKDWDGTPVRDVYYLGEEREINALVSGADIGASASFEALAALLEQRVDERKAAKEKGSIG